MPFKHHAEHRHHIPKPRYRVTNGPEYDAALRRRGSLTVWFTDAAIAAWRAEPRTTPGGQPHYSALAIVTALTMRAVFRLALRQTEEAMGRAATLDDEDAKRPSRERENLVAECTRISNRLKSALARLGIRGFKPLLRRAPQRLAALRTPEDLPIPPNMLAEMERDMARLAVVRAQIKEIERTRLQALQQAPEGGPHAMVRLLARIVGVGIETADMLVREVLSRNLRDRRAIARYAGLTGSPDESDSKRREKGLQNPAMAGCAAG